MLGLYLYTLIIGHKSYNMLNIQDVPNKLTLRNKLQNVVTTNVFLDKELQVKTQQQ